MAQIVKLRRSSTSGKVPTTANLELGELAMNTYDGRIFFEKNTDGAITIEEIVTTDTERPITGSLNINGAITASYFVGDGSGLTGLSSAANGQLTVQGTGALGGSGTFTANQSTNTTISITFDGNGTNIVSGSSQLNNTTINELTINSGSFGSGSGSPTFSEFRYNNSNVMSFNQMYLGNQNGSYFSNGEYQKVVTIIPSSNSENYQIVGRITAQNAGETHTVYFNAALRSNTLPDLNWTITYHEEYNGSRYINPLLWTKETTTAGFIFAFETLGTIYGNVTVDMDVIPRTSALLDNVTVNTNQSSEQSSVDTGYTSNEFSKTYGVNGSNVLFSNGIVSGSVLRTLNGTGVVSGSVLRPNGDGIISQSQQVDYNNIQNKPSIPTVGDGTITIIAGTALSTGGSFTTNQLADGDITLDHSSVTRTNTTSTASPGFGATFTAVDSVTSSTEGHITGVNTKTITLPVQSTVDDVSVSNLKTRLGEIDENINIGDVTGRTFTFRNNIIVSGDLTVQGTTTTTTSNQVNIGDNILNLNYGGSATVGGIYIADATGGSTTSGSFIWDAATDNWKAGLSGSEYSILTTNSNTDDLSEGSTNLYYTTTRFDSDLSGKSTDDLTEGSTNLYYSDNLVKSKLNTDNVVSGSVLRPNGNNVVSESAQISYTGIIDKPNLFGTIAVSGQSNVSADTDTDTLNLVEGSNITITTNASTDSVTITSTDTTYSNGTGLDLTGTTFSFSGNGTDVVSGSVLRPNGNNVVSESAQISYTGITDVPSGIVSQSTQVVTYYNSDVSKVNSSEITAATETAVRRYSPADIKDFITTHASTANTTYDLSVQAGGANTSVIRLVGSDTTTDDVTLSGGTGITISETGNTITITGTSQYGDSDVLSYINSLNVFTASAQVDYDSIQNQPTIPNAIFKTIAVSGENNIVADSATDTLTLAAGSNVTITTDNTTDTITITSANDNTTYSAGTGLDLTGTTFSFDGKGTGVISGSVLRPNGDGVVSGSVLRPNGDGIISQSQQVDYDSIQNQPTIPSAIFKTIAVSGQDNIVADSATDTLTLVEGSNVTITTNNTTDTITITSANDDTTYSAGTGLDLSGTTFSFDGKGTGVVSQSVQISYTGITDKPTIGDGIVTIQGSNGLAGSGEISMNQSADETVTITHATLTPTANTSTASPSHGGTFTVIDSVTFDSYGHPTAYNTKTVTLPTDNNTTYSSGTGLDLSGTTFSFDGKGTGVVSGSVLRPNGDSVISGSASDVRTFLNVENGATADQSNAEIETAYNAQVSQVSSAERTAGTATAIRRFAPADVKSMIDTHQSDTTYSTATTSTLGLIKIEDSATQTVAANTVTATAGRTYGVQLNSSNQAVVNVPWTDTDTVYVHPDITATNTTSTASPSHGGTFTAVDSVTVNSNGHVTEFNTKTVTLPSDNNTDVDVSVSNLETRLGQINSDINIGDATGRTFTFRNNVIVNGNLTVEGDTVTLNASELNVEDALISVGRGTTTAAGADDYGFHISGSDVRFTWNNSSGYMNLNKDLNVDSTISATTIHLGSTNTSSFLTGDSKLSIDGYMMVKGLVNTGETGTGPAAITFGNGSTLGTDEISLIAGGITQIYLNTSRIDLNDVVNVNDTTQSTSKTTGALIVDGGVGIAKTLNVGEDVVAYASSDERYKDNVTPIQNPNEKLKQIGGYTFDWNDKHEVFKGQHDVGVIAQEIEKVLPEIVETRESGYKAVKYEKIVALLIESNKELLKRVEELESKLK